MSSFEAIKSGLDIIEVAERYTPLKKVNENDYLAVNNPIRDEKTSSFHIFVDSQRWHDFGSGEGGDVFDFIAKVENISLSEAKAKLAGSYTPNAIKREIATPSPPSISDEQLMQEFNAFEPLTFKNYRHKSELLAVAPKWLYEQADKRDLDFFRTITRYDSRHGTLVALWAKDSLQGLQAVTYKRRRFKGGKWINRAGTHPNATPISRVYLDNRPIFLVEGMRDFLVGVLLGLNIISVPTAGFKNVEALREFILIGDRVRCIVEDEAGLTCMLAIEESLKERAKIELICLTSDKNTKLDLSDYVMEKSSIEEVLNGL